MNRETIEKLLKDNGVAEDKIKAAVDTIMDTNGKDIEAEKAKAAAKESELTKANQTIKELKATVDKFDGKDPDKLQEDLAALQTKYDTDIAAERKKAGDTLKSFALKEQLAKAGVLDPDYLIYKHGGIDKFMFDKENSPVGIEDAIKPYKADKTLAHLFKAGTPPYDPKNGGSGGIDNPFAKETFNLTKQGELLKSNPEQAKAMAAAAGVTI